MNQNLKAKIKNLLMLFIASCMFVSCQQGRKENKQNTADAGEIVKGELVIGHEVESFTPTGSNENYWIVDSSDKLKKAYDSLTVNSENPYTPIFAELRVKNEGKSSEGFAADYDGVYEVLEVINVRNLKESEIHFTYEQLAGSDGSKLEVLYDTKGEKPTASITYGEYGGQVLTQTEAWSKGAEYANDIMKWRTNAEGGELQLDGKKLFFKKQK